MVSNHSCTLYQTEEMKADWIACKTTSFVVFHFRLHWWIWFFPKLLLHYYLHHTLLLSSLRIFSVTVNTKIWKRSEDHRFFFSRVFQQFFLHKARTYSCYIKKACITQKSSLIYRRPVDQFYNPWIHFSFNYVTFSRDRGPPVHQFPLITIMCYPSQRKLLLLYY